MDKLIISKAEELAEALKDSEVYNRYLSQLEELKKHETLYNRVNEYRIENMKLMSMSADEWVNYGQEMTEKYRDIYQHDVARDFLATEDELCTLLWKIKEKIYNLVDMDLDFLG